MGREFELKFAATAQIHQAVEAKYGPFETITMETTYFDTPDGALAARFVTLRQRLENGVRVCTVKTPLADGGKGEWEICWDDPATMVEKLCQAGAPDALLDWTKDGIVAICGARFTRRAKTIACPGGSVELALDAGVLLGGGREIPLCELEVELKSGDDAVAEVFATQIAAEFDLKPERRSKFRRAQLLAKGE